MSIYVLNSETEVSAVADADEFALFDSSAGAIMKAGADKVRSYVHSGVVDATAATLAVTQAAHGGQIVTANRAAGVTATLPAASGTGAKYQFIVGTTVTSNDFIVEVANATDVMTGLAVMAQDAADTLVGFETAATSDTITMNGTTKGGIRGDSVECIDIASGLWWVRVMGSATGTEVTPFSAAVS